MIISTLFISIGIVGVSKQRIRLLTVHFIYSLILYVFSLIGVVLLVLYCDAKHAWWVYSVGFFVILFQAVGMKHSRMLICLLRKSQTGEACAFSQKMRSCEINNSINDNSENIPMYPMPSSQFVTMEMQPQMMNPQFYPQFYPMQFPMNNNINAMNIPQQQQAENQPIGFFPVVYKQI